MGDSVVANCFVQLLISFGRNSFTGNEKVCVGDARLHLALVVKGLDWGTKVNFLFLFGLVGGDVVLLSFYLRNLGHNLRLYTYINPIYNWFVFDISTPCNLHYGAKIQILI